MFMFSPRWAFALPLLLLVPAVIYARSRTALLITVAAVLVIGGPVSGFNVPWQRITSTPPAGTPFRVITLNMHYAKVDPAALDLLIVSERPDVIAIQEWPGSVDSSLKSEPDWHVHATPRLFVASRHPIRKVVDLGDNSMGEHASAARYDLDTPAGLVHVISMHTATTRQGITDTIHENRKGPTEIRANSARRREQANYVAGRASECTGPILIVGDMNTPPESPIIPDVWTGFADAFTAAGWGWGYTFHGSDTMVRIDHILAGRGWAVAGCRVGSYVGSPHRPVIADLVGPHSENK
jgi:endonuclease/exonuclease/phosphatase (EEP) superfamily protein YafD